MGGYPELTRLSIGLYDSELSRLSLHLNCSADFARFIVEISHIILEYCDRILNINDDKVTGRLVLIQDNLNQSRVIIYHQDHKYVSVQFPFLFNTNSRQLYCKGHEITPGILQNIDTILNELYDGNRLKIGKFGLPITLSEIYEKIINSSEEDDNITFFEVCLSSMLLTVEAGYIRYDFDIKKENGKIHPLHHLDINFSKFATYKQGLYARLESKQFENLFVKETEKLYLHPYHQLLDNKKESHGKKKRKSIKKKIKKRKNKLKHL